MAFVEPLKEELDAWLLVSEARLMDSNSPIDPLASWEMHYVQFPTIIIKLALEALSDT